MQITNEKFANALTAILEAVFGLCR